MYSLRLRVSLATAKRWALSSFRGPRHGTPLLTALRDSTGALLIESVVAITVLALIGAAVLSGVSSSRTTGVRVEHKAIAEKVARNQMEYVFSLPYQNPQSTPYPTVVAPEGYSVTVVANEYKSGITDIEKIIVNVLHRNQNILLLETLRGKK